MGLRTGQRRHRICPVWESGFWLRPISGHKPQDQSQPRADWGGVSVTTLGHLENTRGTINGCRTAKFLQLEELVVNMAVCQVWHFVQSGNQFGFHSQVR